MSESTVIILVLSFLLFVLAIYVLSLKYRMRNNLLNMLDILHDISEGNRNRRILIKEKNELAPLVFELNQIMQMYEDKINSFEQAKIANKQLMTSLSHDVRTPLATLIGYIDAINKNMVSDDEQNDYLITIQQKANDLKEYIDMLFEWFKVNSNDLSLNMEEADLVELTRNILVDWIPTFEIHSLDYHFTIPEITIKGNIDIDCYHRVVNNLLQNVLNHSKANEINFDLSKQNNQVIISIADNGVGIDDGNLETIFKRLYKIDYSRNKKGSGLGLSIVNELIKKMNGSIRVKSQVGMGTKFEVCLPITE
ncbi:TPA: HAMP domain-containing histidine kinase [Listeria monocytogenes]|nr:HAMP domain-containing histidine kinase [Listeria monocytogenes]HEL9061360.1 HAMP domain-containing histidine kinase [Listeria monocytogenes]